MEFQPFSNKCPEEQCQTGLINMGLQTSSLSGQPIFMNRIIVTTVVVK